MKLEYEVTTDDFLAFNMYHAENSSTVKKSILIQRFAVSASFILMPIVLNLILDNRITMAIPIFVVISILCFIYYPMYFKSYIKKHVNKMLNEGENRGVTGRHQLLLKEEGLTEITEIGETKTSWSAVQKVGMSEKQIFIYISAMMAYIVPKRAFGSEEEMEDFLSLINNYRGNSVM